MTTRGLAPAFATIAFVTVLGIACRSSVPMSPSPASSGAPAGQASPPTMAACAPIDLRLPSGAQLDLTGTWQGARSVTFVRQVGSCVSWISLSDNPNQELGAWTMATFRGEVGSDFTLSGAWMWIVRPATLGGPMGGSVTFEIDVATETLALRSTTTTIQAEGGGPYGAATLEYAGPLPPSEAIQ